MRLSVALRVWNIWKCKGLVFAQFWSKSENSSSKQLFKWWNRKIIKRELRSVNFLKFNAPYICMMSKLYMLTAQIGDNSGWHTFLHCAARNCENPKPSKVIRLWLSGSSASAPPSSGVTPRWQSARVPGTSLFPGCSHVFTVPACHCLCIWPSKWRGGNWSKMDSWICISSHF